MRLLLLESEPAVISRIQSIFPFPILLDHTPSLSEARRIALQENIEAILLCRLEWLPVVRDRLWGIPIIFLPLERKEVQRLRTFPLRPELPLCWGSLQLLPSQQRVFLGKQNVALRKMEYQLLISFLKYPETTLRYSFLLQHTWEGWHRPKLNTLHRHVSNLRQRLSMQTADVRITTVHGVGYRLEAL